MRRSGERDSTCCAFVVVKQSFNAGDSPPFFCSRLYRATTQAEAEEKFNALMKRLPTFIGIAKEVRPQPFSALFALFSMFPSLDLVISTKRCLPREHTDVLGQRSAMCLRRTFRESIVVDSPFGGVFQPEGALDQPEISRNHRLCRP